MKINLTVMALITILSSACKNSTQNNVMDEAAKSVVKTFGGNCKYLVKWETSTEQLKKSIIILELKRSSTIEELSSNPSLPASGVAYTFYRGLKRWKSKFTHIKVNLIYKNGEEIEFEYPIKELESLNRQMYIVQSVVALIRQQKFDEIKPLLNDTSYLKYDKSTLIRNVKLQDKRFGVYKDFLFIGYRFVNLENGHVNLHISGLMTRSLENNRFSLDVDTADKSGRIIAFNYTF